MLASLYDTSVDKRYITGIECRLTVAFVRLLTAYLLSPLLLKAGFGLHESKSPDPQNPSKLH